MFISHARWQALLLATTLAGLAVILTSRVQPAATAMPTGARAPVAANAAAQENHPAPDFALPDMGGETVRLAELRGQVVLVNIWATWCPPCRAEMPMLQSAYDQYRDQGFTVLAVNQREDAETVARYLAAAGLTFPALLDSEGVVAGAYRAQVFPSSFFIDRAGVVRAVYRGPLARGVIAGTLEQLLAEGR